MTEKNQSRLPPRVQLVLAVCILALTAYLWWRGQANPAIGPAPADTPVQNRDDQRPATRNSAKEDGEASPLIKSVAIRNLDGKVVFRGQTDLSETVARIQAGRKLRQFRNDGITFENRERRLPRKPAGYYREWVHPTPGLSGPGPQRIVTGKEGEFYYTPDHYESFERLEVGAAKTP